MIRVVEYYEMAQYMGAISVAESCDNDLIAELLMKNMEEEMAADEKLKLIIQESLAQETLTLFVKESRVMRACSQK